MPSVDGGVVRRLSGVVRAEAAVRQGVQGIGVGILHTGVWRDGFAGLHVRRHAYIQQAGFWDLQVLLGTGMGSFEGQWAMIYIVLYRLRDPRVEPSTLELAWMLRVRHNCIQIKTETKDSCGSRLPRATECEAFLIGTSASGKELVAS